MTGLEAVSNGVTAFQEPGVPRAQRTLTFIVAVLGLLLAGVAFLCRVYGVGAMDQEQPGYQSVVSQRVAAVVGRGFIYYVSIASVLAVLCLSVNTSFAGFPGCAGWWRRMATCPACSGSSGAGWSIPRASSRWRVWRGCSSWASVGSPTG